MKEQRKKNADRAVRKEERSDGRERVQGNKNDDEQMCGGDAVQWGDCRHRLGGKKASEEKRVRRSTGKHKYLIKARLTAEQKARGASSPGVCLSHRVWRNLRFLHWSLRFFKCCGAERLKFTMNRIQISLDFKKKNL